MLSWLRRAKESEEWLLLKTQERIYSIVSPREGGGYTAMVSSLGHLMHGDKGMALQEVYPDLRSAQMAVEDWLANEKRKSQT